MPYYLHKLVDDFEQRKRRNSNFSLRSYARFLKIQPSSLSAIFRQKRVPPLAMAKRIAQIMTLSPTEAEQFISSVHLHKKKSPLSKLILKVQNKEITLLKEEAHYHIIAEWEHYAILSLMDLDDFQLDPKTVAERLEISVLRAQSCIERLNSAGLIAFENDRFVKRSGNLKTSEDVMSVALRKSHHETLEIAKQKLESIPIDCRDFSSITFTADSKCLAEIKQLIRVFRNHLAELMEQSPGDTVFQFSMQLFPLSKVAPAKTSVHAKSKMSKKEGEVYAV